MAKIFDFEALPAEIVQLFQELQDWTIFDIARRIKKMGGVTATAEYQLAALSDYRLFDINFQKELKKILRLTNRQLEILFKEALEHNFGYSQRAWESQGIPFIPLAENYFLQRLFQNILTQTQGQMTNITRSLGFAVRTAQGIQFQPVAQFYQQQLDLATTKVITGVQTFEGAIKDAVKTMVKSGLRTVNYSTGHTDRIDVAARRAVMMAVSDLTNRQSEYNSQEIGTTIYEISWHGGFRPSHGWGGRRFDTTGKYYPTEQELYEQFPSPKGEVGSMDDYNCYHFKYAVFRDSPTTYTDAQLDEMNAHEQRKTTFEGMEFTQYEARQQQRAMERAMIKQRGIIAGYEGAELAKELLSAKVRYTQQRKLYKQFSERMGLPTEFERVYTGLVS